MTTPICDFVADYTNKKTQRLHMPGHKGQAFLGCESLDITEVTGADDLYAAEGIILESEHNASTLFGSRHTFYSAGGSSQSIKAMLFLALQYKAGSSRTVLAARNAHKAFLHAAALLDISPAWLYPEQTDSLCACPITAGQLEQRLQAMSPLPFAVYITTPDYLGGMLDVAALAAVCHRYRLPLLVDNAHGAYLRFLQPSAHPLDLGADLCCDSAHKTLPVLTGGAYLHVNTAAPAPYEQTARNALALFGSSSPSYLILQSLDACNRYLADDYPQKLAACIGRIDALKAALCARGLSVRKGEALKLVLDAGASGSTGSDFLAHLQAGGIEPEYTDHRFVALMFTPETPAAAFEAIEMAFCDYRLGKPLLHPFEPPVAAQTALSPRQALFCESERVPVGKALGRVCASAAVACPPAIPIAVSGEILCKGALCLFLQQGITHVDVVKEPY